MLAAGGISGSIGVRAVAENQPGNNQNRMTSEFSEFAARWREHLLPETLDSRGSGVEPREDCLEPPGGPSGEEAVFNRLALELFRLQFRHNPPYRRFCDARGVTPDSVTHWTRIPAMPASAFKELELSCLPVQKRTNVFHSSGTTEHRPGRHFHSPESLALYGDSLWPWFRAHLAPEVKARIPDFKLLILTPPPAAAAHSSLVHMFDCVRRKLAAPVSAFAGKVSADRSWNLDLGAVLTALGEGRRPLVLLGTAFSFVHLLDHLGAQGLRFRLPPGSRAMETGGYKGRSRSVPRAELHSLITERLGIPPARIVCEYGMSELSSQAYDRVAGENARAPRFHFPRWARARIISPETGRDAGEGETGLVCVVDLANVFSVLAIQTEDLAVRRGDGFEFIGRSLPAAPRGCSLMMDAGARFSDLHETENGKGSREFA